MLEAVLICSEFIEFYMQYISSTKFKLMSLC